MLKKVMVPGGGEQQPPKINGLPAKCGNERPVDLKRFSRARPASFIGVNTGLPAVSGLGHAGVMP